MERKITNTEVFKRFVKTLKSKSGDKLRRDLYARIFYRIGRRLMEDNLFVSVFVKEKEIVMVDGKEIKGEYGQPMIFKVIDPLLTFSYTKEGYLRIAGSSDKVFKFELTIIPV